MGLRDVLRGKRVYFDANIFIYLVEGSLEFAQKLQDIRKSIQNGECEIVTSELTLCEVLVVPFRNGDSALAGKFRDLIEATGAFEVVPTSKQTYIRASLYRAQHGLKTPDAIHVATAVEAGCAAFLTNDKALEAPRQIEMLKLRNVS